MELIAKKSHNYGLGPARRANNQSEHLPASGIVNFLKTTRNGGTAPVVRAPLARASLLRALAVGMLAALLVAGCASSGDVKEIQQQNQVQDQRLRALE